MDYILKSARLGFRAWTEDDLDALHSMNQDDRVMAYFPAKQNREQCLAFIHRMQGMQRRRGFCYFAVEELRTGGFLGFIGLCEQNYEADFTPCVDIGWRLRHGAWGKGYATEGAKRCLEAAFAEWRLPRVVAVASLPNIASIRVMEKIGMSAAGTFDHPALLHDERLKTCALYVAEPPTE